MKAFFRIYSSQAMIFLRDRITLVITLVLPLLLSLFFSLIFSSFESAQIKLTIVNEDTEMVSGFIIDSLIKETSREELDISLAENLETALEILEKGKTNLVIVFPKGTSAAVNDLTKCKVPVYYDSNSMESAGIARNLADIILAELNLNVNLVPRVFYSEAIDITGNKKSLAEFYVPNFLAISILWLSIFATAVPIVKQREEKILLRIGTTPVSGANFMAATTLWRLTIGIIQSLLFLIMAVFLLRIDISEVWQTFIPAIILANLAFTTMGYMIASISKTVQNAEAISQLFNFVFMFLSGVFFTTGMLPEIITTISYAIPLTYMADMFRQIMVNYKGLFPLWIDFAVLGGCVLLFSGISLKAWRWN